MGHPRNFPEAVLRVARPQGVEGSGMAGPGETLGSHGHPCHTPMQYDLIEHFQQHTGEKRAITWQGPLSFQPEGEFHDQGEAKWIVIRSRPVRDGVSKGEEDGRRPTALRAGHPPNGV
jgi:hypothetical protein